MQTDRFITARLSRLGKVLAAGSLLLLLPTVSVFAAIWYLAPDGNDTNSGTIGSPFLTITRAQSAVSSGDTVYLRGGTNFLYNSNLTATNSAWVIVNNITKSGISYLAYPGEDPIFNFTNVKPTGYRVTAFLVNASDCVFQGFEVVGVQVTIAGSHTQSECFRITGGNHNTFERLSMHDGMANGWYLTGGSSNLVLNCDAYNNAGLDGGSLGNTDGFGCHPSSGGKGNVFRGCRAWFNSDDGYDCINSVASVTFDHCWSFFNGYYTNFTSTGGDANGFKVGGYGCSSNVPPAVVPVHTVTFCVSARNHSHGFYANHQTGQAANWYNNTAYNNVSANFDMLEAINTTNNCSVAGTMEVLHNNLAYVGTLTADLNETGDLVSYNSWTLPVTVNAADFASVDATQMTQSRKTDGSLPDIAFMHLVNGSDLIDAGTNIGFAFNGSAPDLGAFESLTPFQAWQSLYFGPGYTNNPAAAPDADPDGDGMSNTNEFLAGTNPTNSVSGLRILSIAPQSNDVVITWTTAGGHTNAVQATGGDANGGYITNFIDLSGPIILPGSGDATTNYIDAGGATNTPARYYRIRLAP
jgi:pectate lyase